MNVPDAEPDPVVAAIRDVTEGRRAEELKRSAVLLEGEEGFRSIANSAPVLIWVSGPDKQCTYFNETWLEFTGRSMEAELGNGWADGVHPEDLQRCLDTYTQSFDRREKFRMEYRLRRHDGEYRSILDVGVPRFNPDSSFAGYIGIGFDITERKRAEEGLQESEERLRMAIQAGKMFAYEWDAATDKIVRSEGVTQVLGEDEGAHTTGQHILTLIPPQDRERLIAAVAQLTPEKPNLRISYRMVRSDGTVIWVDRTSRAYFDDKGKMLRIVGMLVDITDRVRAEEDLRQKDTELSEAQRLAGVGSWHWDVRNDVVTWSEELYRIAGRDPMLPAPNYKEYPGLLSAESWGRLQRAAEATLRDGRSYELDLEMVRPDGTTRWVTARAEAVRDTTGRIVRLRGTTQDITERKLAEEALRESEERFRLAAQAGRMYAFDWDVVTDVIIRSEESTHIFGLIGEPTTLTKQELLARVHPEDRATFINSLAECTPESPNTQISYRLLRPDGSVLWLERNGHAFFDEQGRMVRMIGMVTDVTERKLAENKLQEYERAVEGLEEMIVVVDREYRYLIANNKFLKMRNMTKKEVVGRFAHEVLNKGVFETVVKEKLDECFQGKVVKYEMKYTYPELGERDIFVSYFPIEGATGVDRVACILQDITERKLAEEALSTVSQKLIAAHEEERTRIARELHDDVGQRMALLTVHLDTLKQGRFVSADELGSQIADLHKQAKDLGRDVQALSHELHSSKLDYLGLAGAAAGFCRELSDRHGVEIEFHSEDIPKELPREISLCLFRVLQEALQNAIKHSGSRQFQVSLGGGANDVELTVHDSGIGFEPEEAIKGRGLGLTSMKERLRLVDGEFSIDSQLQRGTTLHARVPLSREDHSMGAAG